MKVIVIGGGVMGLSCAWRLAQGGAQVVLFERGRCGEGATLASLGALWPASPLAKGPLQELHRRSLCAFRDFARELAAAAGLPVTWRRLGRIELLNSHKAEARAREEAAFASAHWSTMGSGEPAMMVLSPEDLAAGGGGDARPALARREFGALQCRATAQVKLLELVGALVAACRRAGVEIQEHAALERFEQDGKRVMRAIVGTSGREGRVVEGDAFLVAAGANSSQLVMGGDDVAPTRPVQGQGIALALPAGFHLSTIFKSGKIYLVPWDDHVLVGSTTEPDAGDVPRPTAEGRAFLMAGAAALFPVLGGAPVLRHWAGLRPQNPRKPHPPWMGVHPTLANVYFCTGHFKTGIGMAPVAGDLMARAILSGEVPAELLPFAPGLATTGRR